MDVCIVLNKAQKEAYNNFQAISVRKSLHTISTAMTLLWIIVNEPGKKSLFAHFASTRSHRMLC